MKNWGNWSRRELVQAIEKNKKSKNSSFNIDQEHTDADNDKAVNGWLDELGLKYDNGIESTRIYLDKKEVEIKFPEHIMETLRERRGLSEEDTSEDSAINNYTKDEA